MVAISLYRGNLHKVPDVPHRWTLPNPTISLEEFRILLYRRSIALARLQASKKNSAGHSDFDHGPSSNPNDDNPDPYPANNSRNEISVDNHTETDDDSRAAPQSPPREESPERNEEKAPEENGEVKNHKLIDAEDSLRELVDKSDALADKNGKCEAEDDVPVNLEVERSNIEDSTSDKEKREKEIQEKLEILNEMKDSTSDKEKREKEIQEKLEILNEMKDSTSDKRKKEIQEKLEILNEKKHGLVQVLKQILNAEEQFKRQNSTQGMSGRPPLPLQVDTTTDSGSMTKVNTPKLGSDGNPSRDVDGGEAYDVSNQNTLSRHLTRMSSTLPSSESQPWKTGANLAPQTYRATLGVVSSPRFAPAGLVHSLSVSVTNYVASSPSPAASGGTSVFRDARLPSP